MLDDVACFFVFHINHKMVKLFWMHRSQSRTKSNDVGNMGLFKENSTVGRCIGTNEQTRCKLTWRVIFTG